MTDLMDTFVENRWIVQPNHANNHGMAHGGTVMKWMDEVGAMAAMRFAGQHCVTARMDQVNFDLPIPIGEIALVEAFAYDAGSTSVKVRVRAYREDPLTSERERTTESFFVYVAIDDDHNPTSVPTLTVTSDSERELRDAALADEQAMSNDRNGDQ